jgi:hypothetical protein
MVELYNKDLFDKAAGSLADLRLAARRAGVKPRPPGVAAKPNPNENAPQPAQAGPAESTMV